jgi:hypothetical protein
MDIKRIAEITIAILIAEAILGACRQLHPARIARA